MNNREWLESNRKRVMKQYRSNQGRSPKKDKVSLDIVFTVIVMLGITLLFLSLC